MYTFVTFGVLRRKNCESPQDASKGSNEAYTVTTRQRFMCRLATRPVSIGWGRLPISSPPALARADPDLPIGFSPLRYYF